MSDHPLAIIAAEAPLRARASVLPEPFASRMAGREKRPLGDLFGLTNFGSSEGESAKKMREALPLILKRQPRLEVEGEMHVDAALKPEIRERLFPDSRLTGAANLLVMPNLDAANTAYNLTRVMTDGIGIGPVLMGLAKPVHVLTTSATVRRVVNMTAIAAVEAQIREQRGE